MSVVIGYPGSVTWAGATNNAQLATTGAEPVEWRLNIRGDEYETTAFAGTGAQTTFIKGLTQWDGEFTATLKSPEHGALGLVTFAAGYTAQIMEWSIDIVRDAIDVTTFAATERAFLPGLCRINGSFRGFVDDTTSITHVGGSNASEPATGTFKYSERGATDGTLAGSIFTTSGDVDVNPGRAATVAYNWRMSGALTVSVPSTGVSPLKTGTFDPTADVASAITLAADGTKTYSGSAFWKSINLRVAVGQMTTLRVGVQGAGVLTVA